MKIALKCSTANFKMVTGVQVKCENILFAYCSRFLQAVLKKFYYYYVVLNLNIVSVADFLQCIEKKKTETFSSVFLLDLFFSTQSQCV